MTEAWLLLDERAIRHTAGNPNGRIALGLPKYHEAEAMADPKSALRDALLAAGEVRGRRRERLVRRFDECRRQLLESLDPVGPVATLGSWKRLVATIDEVVDEWSGTYASPRRRLGG